MRDYYQSQLGAINRSLVDMGLLLENAIENSISSLKYKDKRIVEASRQIELEIDRINKSVEGLCLNVILHQQPVAGDFRFVSAALKMITDMERIGDIAEDIAITSVMINECRDSKVLKDIIEMGKASSKMLTKGIDAYVDRNEQSALEVCKADDVIDKYFDDVKQQLVAMIKTDDKGAQEAPDLLMIAKYFERLGDHCVNVAEWVLYAVTGSRKGYGSKSDIDEATESIQ